MQDIYRVEDKDGYDKLLELCKDRPYFYNKMYNGNCEQLPNICEKRIKETKSKNRRKK